jgi:hypothetical protein
MRYVLAPDGPVGPDTVVLEVRSPLWTSSSQRLTLDAVRAGDLAEGPVVPLPPYLWDARRTGELRAAVQGGAGGSVEAWTSAGWLIDEVGTDVLGLADPLLAALELRRVAAQFGRSSVQLRVDYRRPRRRPTSHLCLEVAGDQLRVTRRPDGPGPELCLHPALLRPLVSEALFPAEAPPAAGSLVPDGFAEGERIRVRCGTQWHWAGLRGGRLELPHHTEDERRRELALLAFGGAIGGCFRAEIAWHGAGEGMPKRLREYRRDLWRRMEHGGSRVVLALLDAGMDPHVRDAAGRTLLHRIHQFEHAELLPRLLAEGLDVNAVSRRGYTPMCEAVVHSAPHDLLMTLNDAGAIPRLSLMDPRSWPNGGRPALM